MSEEQSNTQQMDLDSGLSLYIRQDEEWFVHIAQPTGPDEEGELTVCIGSGESRAEAVADAVQNLEEAITELRGPSPAEMEETIRNAERGRTSK
jgi:hypothetical protein